MFSKVIIAALVASVVSAAPAPTALESWQITKLYTHSPSGRPGSSPYSTLNVTIYEPNTIPAADSPTGTVVFPPSTANCSAQWTTDADVPWNVETNCTDDAPYGTWTFKITPGGGPGATQDFGLEFKLVDAVKVIGPEVHTRTFTAKDQFQVGVNLAGTCGASGQCNWYLKNSPYAIQQTE